MDITEREAWIALASVDGVGEITFGLLLTDFRSARGALRAVLDGRIHDWNRDFRKARGQVLINAPAMSGLLETASDPRSTLDPIAQLGLWTLTPLDPDYPQRLRDLDPPPAVIHGLGNPETLHRRRTVALVGTRKPTLSGRSLATRICARLVECGATVVSGLAVGIDGAAHAATLEHSGWTVGVIGAGHLHPGPRAHERLRAAVVDGGGAVITEHYPKVKATKGTYPRRNRIIAALGDATIVVEAPRVSGALITARHALELGRQVLVTPGRIGDWATTGSLALLRDTPARPLVGLDEMIEDLGYFAADPDEASGDAAVELAGPAAREAALAMLGPSEKAVAERLCDGPAGLDGLVASTGLAPGVVSSAVSLLLMRGWVHSHGPAYIAAGPLVR